ncbi:MAG: BatA domain-containing protein [Thermoguttaceae bacterium]
MSFLQPFMLFGLPLVALPILIHLINQRRYQTTRWGAMMFLLAAQRMSRGYARLRQWLILLFRMLAVAGLVLAVGRPLASGLLGLAAGGRADTTIILLDCSPSMQQREAGAGLSKLAAGRRQLADTLTTLGSSRWVLIDSTTNQPRELPSPSALADLSCAEPTGAEAELPAMLEAARTYVRINHTGRTEIWICSDLRENDWHADSGRWRTLRESFTELVQGVHFHLLAYPQTAPGNTAVRVTGVRRQQSGERAELLVSLVLLREGQVDGKATIPVEFQIEGARSEVNVEIVGSQYELKDYRIALEGKRERGWGRISIPADANPADNDFFFVFDKPEPRNAIIVSEDPQAAWPLQLAASISPDPAFACAAEVVPREQLAGAAWEKTSLLIWQAPLPQDSSAKLVQAFVERGGQVIFLPPRAPGAEEFLGMRWGEWVDGGAETSVETWRSDQDLLVHTLSGQSLPVGDLKVKRHCKLSGEVTTLAALQGGVPLLARVATEHGGVYFLATTPAVADSSLVPDAVVLYAAVQRAMASGATVLGNTRNLIAGPPPAGIPQSWQRLAGDGSVLSTDYSYCPGVYQAGDRLLAVNRAVAEDQAAVLDDERVAGLFHGLDFARVDDSAGSSKALVQEIWRMFLQAMIVAMMCEAALCLPRNTISARSKEGVAS